MRSIYILFLLLIAPLAWSQTITLKGTVTTDDERPIAQTRISVSGGFGDETDDQGTFNIKLSKDYISGERVLLNVVKEDWVMNYPLDGEWNLPNIQFQQVHTTRVILVPKGSKALWTHARIEKLVAQLSDKVTQLTATNQQLEASATEPQPIDFTYHLAEWAETYGFTVDEVKVAFDQWAEEAQGSTDFRKLGLAAFYQKNYAEAAYNFEQAAQQDESALQEIEEIASEKRLSAFENWKDAGEALYLDYQFDSALVRFERAAVLVTKEMYPMQWVEIRLLTGDTQQELGIRVSGERVHELLAKAVSSYEQVLTVTTQSELPQDWAMTQNNLGIVFRALGTRMGGQQGLDYLQQSVDAYRNALEEYTQSELPQDWAMTQNNLGAVLNNLGIRVGGQQGLDYLQQSVEAYQRALEEYTQSELPQDWAMTQNNLGNVLGDLGTSVGGQQGLDYLQQSVDAYQKALEERIQSELPQQWAMTQNNLGNVLGDLGTSVGGQQGLDYLQQSVDAYQKALEERIQSELPQQWAMTQNNLGTVLGDLGTRVGGQQGLDYLQQSVDAYQKALEERTQSELPQDWAMTQNNLGNVLRDLGIRVGGQQGLDYLQQSVDAYQNALMVRTRQILPLGWAQTQNNLAETYSALEQYEKAAQSYSYVLEVYPQYETAYNFAVYYYHEFAFDYAQAYALNEQWLKQFPDSLSTRTDFAEKQFTTARFSACAQQIQSLLTEPMLSASNRVALRGTLLANTLASGRAEAEVQQQFATLQEEIAHQEADFTVQWTFSGTKNFISQYEGLAPYRDWLLALFDALDQEDRDAILAALDELEATLPTLARNPD